MSHSLRKICTPQSGVSAIPQAAHGRNGLVADAPRHQKRWVGDDLRSNADMSLCNEMRAKLVHPSFTAEGSIQTEGVGRG